VLMWSWMCSRGWSGAGEGSISPRCDKKARQMPQLSAYRLLDEKAGAICTPALFP